MKTPFSARPGPACVTPAWAFHFMCLAYWSFHNRPDLDNAMAAATGLTNVLYYTDPDPKIPKYVAGFDGRGFQVSFSGTDSLRQWLSYITGFGLANATGIPGRTFAPFNAWSDILTESLLANLDASRRITLSGHSLGGAMAILVGEKLRQRGRTVQCVVTYGCPRIGDDVFTVNARNRIVNVRRFLDVIPSVPPAAYVRATSSITSLPEWPNLFRPGNDYLLGVDFTMTQNASNLVRIFTPSGWVDAIDELVISRHAPGNYVIQIWDWLDYVGQKRNQDVYLVMRDGFNIPLSTPAAA